NVDYLASKECHFEVFVNVDLLRAEIDYFFRLPQGTLDLIGRHSHLNGLRLRLLLASTTLALLSTLLLSLLLSALLLLLIAATLRVLRIVADRHQLPDRVLNISCAGFRQGAFGKLK